MQKLEGNVSKLRFSTNVHGGESTSTEQIAVFEINQRVVEIRSYESVIFEEGDAVVVAGEFKNGLFKGLAYKNKSKDITGANDYNPLPGFLSIAIGIASILGFTIILPGDVGIGILIPIFIGSAFVFVGVGMIKTAEKRRVAYEIVSSNSQ